MNWLLSRLTEPSSYGGLAAAIYGINNLLNGQIDAPTIGSVLLGGLAFAVPEAGQAVNAIAGLVSIQAAPPQAPVAAGNGNSGEAGSA